MQLKMKNKRDYTLTILHSGSKSIAIFIKVLSKKGTRASKPHADEDLLALRQS